MTIDKAQLKALAEAYRDFNDSGVEPGTFNPYESDFYGLVEPATVLALLAEIDRLATSRSKKERELEQELETWRHGPFCWACGDTGDVHEITGEWRGECDCLSAQLISANRELDQLKAKNEALREDLALAKQAPLYSTRQDAKRYRWLIRRISKSQYHFLGAELTSNTEAGVGAAIDAAMAKEASHDR